MSAFGVITDMISLQHQGILLDLFEQQDHLFLLLPGGKVFRKQDYENCTKFSTDFKILTFLYFI